MGAASTVQRAPLRELLARVTRAWAAALSAWRKASPIARFASARFDSTRFSSTRSASTRFDSKADVAVEAARLVDQHGNSVLRLAYSYLHNAHDAEDVLQETMIRYLKAAPDFADANHEKAWMLRVAANLCKNQLVRSKAHKVDELSDSLAAEERDDLSYVWDAVKALPQKYREVVHLYYYEGYPTHEIAGILDREESTVRSQLSRGREKLKALLDDGDDDA